MDHSDQAIVYCSLGKSDYFPISAYAKFLVPVTFHHSDSSQQLFTGPGADSYKLSLSDIGEDKRGILEAQEARHHDCFQPEVNLSSNLSQRKEHFSFSDELQNNLGNRIKISLRLENEM